MPNPVAGLLSMITIGASVLALAACSESPTPRSDGTATSGVLGYTDVHRVADGGAPPPLLQEPGPPRVRAGQFSVVKHLAVSHAFTLRLPSSEVEAVQKKHLAECGKLGCTVLNTHLDRSNEGRINARSTVRISPAAYTSFSTIIAAAPSELVSHSETTEDKTVAILDIEKRLEIKRTLRDRLTAMLKDPGAKSPADLAAIEKELAQVQGDIEAAIAQRDYLRTITETVRVLIHYNGRPALVRGVDLSPISLAISSIGRTLVWSVAALISFLAALIPWLPLIAFVWWAVRRSFRRWRVAKAPA